jgi:6,7-dimethyl-8-ribityllumazine synthase
MASDLKNLSIPSGSTVPDATGMRIGIVVSEWNIDITSKLTDAAISTLKKQGVNDEDIIVKWVPGSFELPLGAQFLTENEKADAIICIGCVIQGETKHFDFICDAVAKGITELNLKYNKPFVFGVLTPNNQQQAEDRAGGKHGNKGDEAAITAIKMLALRNSFKKGKEKIGF